MPIEIVPLSKEDIPGAAECIQTAFSNDPYFSFVFSDPSKVCSIPRRCGSYPCHFPVKTRHDNRNLSMGFGEQDRETIS